MTLTAETSPRTDEKSSSRRRRPRRIDPICEAAASSALRGHTRLKARDAFRLGWDAAGAHLEPRIRELEALISRIARWAPAGSGPTLRELTAGTPAERIDEDRAQTIRHAADYLVRHLPDSSAAADAQRILHEFAHHVEIDGIDTAKTWAPGADYETRHFRH